MTEAIERLVMSFEYSSIYHLWADESAPATLRRDTGVVIMLYSSRFLAILSKVSKARRRFWPPLAACG